MRRYGLVSMLAAAIASVGVVSSVSAAEVAVDQRDLKFVPDAVTLKAGDSVRFTDTDRIAHNITIVNANGTSEDKGMAEYNQHIVVTFAKPGLYHAHCRIHPQMEMTIMVRP